MTEFVAIVDDMNDLNVKSSDAGWPRQATATPLPRIERAVREILRAIVNDAAAARADVVEMLRAAGGT